MEVAAKKPTTTALARDCFEIIFEHEITDDLFQFGQYNLYGRTMRGSNDRKFPLDSGKVHVLRALVEDKLPQGWNKETEWHKCVDAIHRRIGELKTECELNSKADMLKYIRKFWQLKMNDLAYCNVKFDHLPRVIDMVIAMGGRATGL